MIARLLLSLCAGGATSVAATASGVAAEVRVITAPGLTPAPTFEHAPERVERPRPPKPDAPIADRRLGPVVVESGERIGARRLTIHLPGVVAVGPDETCRDAAGTDWPCGRQATVGLRALVRLRPVACPLPSDARSGDYTAACSFGTGRDLGEAFVASGWARAEAGGPYEAAEAAAKHDGRGVWGAAPAPVAALPEAATAPTELPPDLTTAPLLDGGGDVAATAPALTAGTPMRLGR
ncbi:MAG: thermonuclease family protein [Phyllobacteriaceae bacterium]|nr:thermonuclease family protein [Phyllobacteriaceae bacterium]